MELGPKKEFAGKHPIKILPTDPSQYFYSFNSFSSKQKLQEALKSWSTFILVMIAMGGKYIEQL